MSITALIDTKHDRGLQRKEPEVALRQENPSILGTPEHDATTSSRCIPEVNSAVVGGWPRCADCGDSRDGSRREDPVHRLGASFRGDVESPARRRCRQRRAHSRFVRRASRWSVRTRPTAGGVQRHQQRPTRGGQLGEDDVDLASGPDVDASRRVVEHEDGVSAMSQRATCTFCWLPPLRVPTLASSSGARTLSWAIRSRAAIAGAPRRGGRRARTHRGWPSPCSSRSSGCPPARHDGPGRRSRPRMRSHPTVCGSRPVDRRPR